jgi:hypothetical protein
MNLSILLFCIVSTMSANSKINLIQDQLCEHKTDGSEKSQGITISLQLPCDWKEMESKSVDQIFKFAKKNDETKVMTSASLSINRLPVGLNSSEEQDLLKPEGLKTLSEGSGEIESSKQLKIDNLNGGEIIRKDEAHNFYKIYNYFIYKKKLISISYYIISASEINVKDYYDAFESYLMKTRFN